MIWRTDFWIRWLLQHASLYLLLTTALSLLAGALAALAYRDADEHEVRHVLEVIAQRHAVQLSADALRGRAMGAAAMLGINEPDLKRLVLGELAPDAPQALARLRPVREALEADGIFVLDANGRVLADVSDRLDSTGLQWLDQPFWQQAFAGRETVYPVAEGDVRQRFIILAAPVYAGIERSTKVIGVVAIRLSALALDASLRSIGKHALLLSPLGLVFASSEDDWNFSLSPAVGPEAFDSLRQQFGTVFEAGVPPRRLPFDPSQQMVALLGQPHLRSQASLQWPDVAGRWQLVLLAPPEREVGLSRLLALAAGVALLVLSLFYLSLRSLRSHQERCLALDRSEAASREVIRQAELKARQSDLTLQLQRARELPALAQRLFAALASFLPVHQGCLYFVQSVAAGESRLELAGSYATARAPTSVDLGEGLLGQCARERCRLVYRNVPDGFWRIESGLGQSLPRSLWLIPLMRNDELIGVLELASMEADGIRIETALESLLPVLAMNLEILLGERRLEGLLAQAREQVLTGRLDPQRHESGAAGHNAGDVLQQAAADESESSGSPDGQR
jgi:hypothetical protein